MLFRFAHQWAPSIETQEYVDLLTKIYDRITHRRLVRGATGEVEDALPSIQIEITQVSQDELDAAAESDEQEEDDGW